MRKIKKEKVDWRFEFKRDNLFNIIMTLLVIIGIALYIEEIADIQTLAILLAVQFYINISSLGFFVQKRFRDDE